MTGHNDDHDVHGHLRDQNLPLPDQFLERQFFSVHYAFYIINGMENVYAYASIIFLLIQYFER